MPYWTRLVLQQAPLRSVHRLLVVASVAFGWATHGCATPPTPCNSPGTCPQGTECIANRCAPGGDDPAPPTARRSVEQALVVGLVSSRSHRVAGELPASVTFGAATDGAVALYLALPAGWRRAGRVHAGFLVLTPLPDAPAGGADIEVTVARVESAVAPASLAWTAQPKHGFPLSHGIARSSPPSTLRVDVTDALRFIADHPGSDHGLVVKADAGNDHGATYSLGAGVGAAVRVEVYWVD